MRKRAAANPGEKGGAARKKGGFVPGPRGGGEPDTGGQPESGRRSRRGMGSAPFPAAKARASVPRRGRLRSSRLRETPCFAASGAPVRTAARQGGKGGRCRQASVRPPAFPMCGQFCFPAPSPPLLRPLPAAGPHTEREARPGRPEKGASARQGPAPAPSRRMRREAGGPILSHGRNTAASSPPGEEAAAAPGPDGPAVISRPKR